MKVAVSGAMGRLGSVIALGISNANDLQLAGLYAPGHAGKIVAGMELADSIERIDAQIIVECAHPGVAVKNLRKWRAKGNSTCKYHKRCGCRIGYRITLLRPMFSVH